MSSLIKSVLDVQRCLHLQNHSDLPAHLSFCRAVIRKAMLKYCAAAAALGCGWFIVLLLPGVTREWLLANIFQNLVCLILASIIVALAARKFISRAETFSENLLRATVIPYLGCLVYISLSAALLWLDTFLYGGLANVHDTLSLYVMGFNRGCRILLCRHTIWATLSVRDEMGLQY